MDTEKTYYRNALISLMAVEEEMIAAGMPLDAIQMVRNSITICREEYHHKYDEDDVLKDELR